jgi:alpha-beta hydrolase superfamily lysophospholipase
MTPTTFKQALTRGLFPLACAVMATNGALAQTSPAAEAAVAGATTTTTTLTAPDGRVIDVTVLAPHTPRGVILFSHGGNSNPLATTALHARLTARGFAVIAPTHTDSRSLPAERQTDLTAAFMTRVTDMKIAAAYAEQTFAGLPMAQVGYSYGSLISLIGGGAFTNMIPGSNPGVKAVVMFSSPGPIPMLTGAPGAFDGVKGPTLLVTGDADKVPGFAEDPAAHLIYFDNLPTGDHTALVVANATHAFPGAKEPGWDEVAGIVDDFLVSRVLDDTAAAARFDAIASSAMVTVKRN